MKVQNFNYFNGVERTGSAQNTMHVEAEDFDINFQQTSHISNGPVNHNQEWFTDACQHTVVQCVSIVACTALTCGC